MNRGYSVIGLVFEFVGILSLPPLIGYFLDSHFYSAEGAERTGWFFIGGVLFGFTGGLYHLVRGARAFLEQKEEWSETATDKKEDTSKRIDRAERELRETEQKLKNILKNGD